MQRSTAKRRVATAAPQAAISLGSPDGRDEGSRHGFALIAFMRVAAALWIAQGLLQWRAILSTEPGSVSAFASLTAPAQVAAVFFAVADLVAAVGLWLAAPWGGVLWLVAVGVQIVVIVSIPDFFDHPLALGLADLALTAGYLALVWRAARAADAAR